MFEDHSIEINGAISNSSELVRGSPRFVVGVGASAGGLESLESLFRNVPTDSGMAFIVIQHLSPDFKSMMSELLARETSIKIRVVEEGDRVEADTIYLLPPKKLMLLADGCLHLSDKDSSQGGNLPIDHFLRSLALECGKRAIAVILSGSGTDGSRGVVEIARHGGLVISESLDTAKFDGMPSSAQATGLVDLVLPPGEIGTALIGYRNHPASIPKQNLIKENRDRDLKGFAAIVQIFRDVYDIDFSIYKENTVLRRTRRRLSMTHLETIEEYADHLRSNTEELHALYKDLLIGVTQFFRDPKAFSYLTDKVLSELVRKRAREIGGIRGWIAGCATGEEAYSVAIAFQEAQRLSGISVPIKLFATDVHKRSIEHASRGLYPFEIANDVSDDYLKRYFIKRENGYQILPEIRRTIVFAPHNILRDAPFTDLDFVSCRNLLIYFQPTAQRRAISLFHYGLRVGGVLFLGSSESPGELSGEFTTEHEQYKLYNKSRDVRLAYNLRSPLNSSDVTTSKATPAVSIKTSKSLMEQDLSLDGLLDQVLPPSILVDRNRMVRNTYANAQKLLRFPDRQPSLDVLDLVEPEIRTMLAGALKRAETSHQLVSLGHVLIGSDDQATSYRLSVKPVSFKGDDQHYLISFTTADSKVSIQTKSADSLEQTTDEIIASREHIQQLENDLRHSRENLQATIEELETSNEELQATNEELIASNEELQSTNEELHSLNEELYSVNAEHQRKIEELAEVNRDMGHLLENTDVATIFLDENLHIRRFTSRVREIFDLIDTDIGRPIFVFASKLKSEDIEARLREALETGEPYEREVSASEGTSYLMRILPYRNQHKVDGVVIMWVDISSIEVLRGRLRWMSAIVESTSDAVIGQCLNGTITSWNQGAEKLYGYTAAEMIGQSIEILVPENRLHEVEDYRARIIGSEIISSVDTIRVHKDGTPINISLTVSPVFDGEGRVIGISKIARDITDRIKMERQIREQIKQRERFLAVLSHELRNPLNALSTATGVLLKDSANEQMKVAASQTIQRQVETMNYLLGDLLDVARIAENRINLNFERLDLRELATDVQELLQPELDRYHCQLFFELPSEPVKVKGDRTRLMQVLVNLIQNAAKYSESTEPIRVTMKSLNRQIHLTIADEGRGIEADKLDLIFQPFTQLDRARHQSDVGMGVGLALVKTLVELHGGRVYAESEGPNRGSVFHVWLPELEANPLDHEDNNAENTGTAVAESFETEVNQPQNQRPLKICVVEDVPASREMLKTLLELDGHQVFVAENGVQGVEIILKEKPDLALVDIGLPDISGYQVAQMVRDSEAGQSLALIALTGYGQPGDVEEAMQVGFNHHILKPISPNHLNQIYRSVQP